MPKQPTLNQQLKKESLTPAQRAQKLKELRPRMVKYLTDNCTCETERKAFPLLNNETLATLVNEKQQGSNADATGDGSFKNAKNAGGWDDVKGKGDAFYDDDDEVSDDEEDETEKEPPNTGGGPDEVRGRKGVSNMRITANQADMFSRAVFGKPLAQVREEQRLAGNVLRHEKTKVIKKLVAHLPRERAEQTVLNMRLYDKSLEELHDLVALQPPPAVNSGFDDADELRSPIYAAGGMPPLMNEEFVDNSGAASDIECLVPPTINYKQWQEEDRGTRNGRAIRQHANDGIESFNTTGDMM